MRKKHPSSRQTAPVTKKSQKQAGAGHIRRLTVSDDLGVLFSSGQENERVQSFAGALATGIPAATLADILTEKEELPSPALRRPMPLFLSGKELCLTHKKCR
ncbi:MAG: hypothetical protein OEV89_06285 [Desulfobulbaceae bacterium]|nr:hypothetical protein [Desulfobulbaceae bacterium]HIJ90359.1 hypothetical protein [Deltaproteobacteria bacterium]